MSTQAKAHDNPLQTVSVTTTTNNAAVTESFTTVKSTKRGMTGPSRKRTMTQESSRAPRDLYDSVQCVLPLPKWTSQCQTNFKNNRNSVKMWANTTTYAETTNQWSTIHKNPKTMPAKTVQKGSAIIGSAKNVVIRAAKLSDLGRHHLLSSCSRLNRYGSKVVPGLVVEPRCCSGTGEFYQHIQFVPQ